MTRIASRLAILAIVPLALLACSQEPSAPADEGISPAVPSVTPAPARSMSPSDAGKTFPSGEWETVASGEGDGLFFGVTEGEPARVHMFCPADGGLLVNVNGFRPIGSEERMALGSGGTVVALVADPAGDANRGGVSGEGSVPADLPAILTGAEGVGVSYGAQTVALPPVPAAIARAFVTGCTD